MLKVLTVSGTPLLIGPLTLQVPFFSITVTLENLTFVREYLFVRTTVPIFTFPT